KLESRRCVDRDAVQPVEHEVDQPLHHLTLQARLIVRRGQELEVAGGQEQEYVLDDFRARCCGDLRVRRRLLQQESVDERKEARERQLDELAAALLHLLLGPLFPIELVPVQLLRLLAQERAPVLTESRRTRRHEWRLKQALEPGATSRKQDLRMESSWRLRSAHSAPVTVAAKIRPLLAGGKPLQTELLEQPLLPLALDVRLQLQVRLESAARQLLAEQ